MIEPEMLEALVDGASQAVLSRAQRLARDGHVDTLEGDQARLQATVADQGQVYEVWLWSEGETAYEYCPCTNAYRPCVHSIAAALVLRGEILERRDHRKAPAPVEKERPKPIDHEAEARKLRVTNARKSKLVVRWLEGPVLEVRSGSDFTYRVRVRGGPEGPHRCSCPDFESNELHTCKHVEHVRTWLSDGRHRRRAEFEAAIAAPHVYLYYGETLEPRLFRPKGSRRRMPKKLLSQFTPEGRLRQGRIPDEKKVLEWMRRYREWVDPIDLEWLEQRQLRRPQLPRKPIRDLAPPLKRDPYPYQWKGIEFLARRGRALLADEMGLGKTGQAIVAAAILRKARPPVQSVLIIAPATLLSNWAMEIDAWLGEESVNLGRLPARKRAKVIAERPPWLITNYERVWRDYKAYIEHPPDLLIVDEAQRAKNYLTRTSRVTKAIPARYIFVLTGTPLENRLEEAHSIAQFIDQRLLPPLWRLDRDHFVRTGPKGQVIQYRNLRRLQKRLKGSFLRRTKEAVGLQLPEKIRIVEHVPMHKSVVAEHAALLKQVAQLMNSQKSGPLLNDKVQKLLVRARRCCDGPHMVGRSVPHEKNPKLKLLIDLLQELCVAEEHKVVVFSEWTTMTDTIAEIVKGMGLACFHLHGKVPVESRQRLMDSFSSFPGPAVFVSTDSGGVGINLQAADVVINMDLPWDPAKLEQRLARVHRVGSKHEKITEILIICEEGIERRIEETLETKREVFENVWTDDGEDEVIAPSGTGAFHRMVEVLVALEAKGTERLPDRPPKPEELPPRLPPQVRQRTPLEAPPTHGRRPPEDLPLLDDDAQGPRIVVPGRRGGAPPEIVLPPGVKDPRPKSTRGGRDAEAPEAASSGGAKKEAKKAAPAAAASVLDPGTIAGIVAAVTQVTGAAVDAGAIEVALEAAAPELPEEERGRMARLVAGLLGAVQRRGAASGGRSA